MPPPPRRRPDVARLALDLDGCRFGDSPRGRRRHGGSRLSSPAKKPSPSSAGDDAAENRHPNRRHPAASVPATPPSPLGGTYRAEGLSIGRDFLRFRGRAAGTSGGALRWSAADLEVLGCVGRGACSSVWRARRRPGPGPAGARAGATHYALKVFPLRDPARRSMLVRELSLLCACRCDCLVGLEGAFADDGDAGGQGVTLVLEYMDRGSLADLLHGGGGGRPRRARLPDAALAAVSFQVFWGLSYLHFEGVLHRDVKPANVLVSAAGRVKLADFGIVSRRPPGDAPGASPLGRTVVGTTRYMAPERLRGRPHGRPSDVWGAGLVLLEAARGDAGPGEGVTSVVELVQTLEETDMAEYVPASAGRGLRDVLLGCLAIEPRKRIPASVLLAAPWFRDRGVRDVDGAAAAMARYLAAAE